MPARFDHPVPLGIGCGGIDQYADPRIIADSSLIRGKNLFPNTQGILGSRPTVAFQELGPNIGTNILAFALAAPETGYRFVAATSGGVTAWTDATTAVGISFKNKATKRPFFINFLGETLCLPRNGEEGVYVLQKVTGPTYQWVHRSFVVTAGAAFDGTGFTTQTQDNGAVCPDVAFVYGGSNGQNVLPKLVFASLGPNATTALCMSDGSYPATFARAAGAYVPAWVFIGADALAFNAPRTAVLPNTISDAILAGSEIQLQATGSPVQVGGLLLTTKGGFILTGAFLETWDQSSNNPVGSAELSRINLNCGIAGPNTLTRTPYGLIWAGADDVWMLDLAGQVPRRIGTKIRNTLLTAPPQAQWRWTAAYFNGVFILGVCTEEERNTGGGNEVPDYHCNWQYFWLDLRGGPPQDPASAQWHGPMEYAVSNLGPIGEDSDFYTGLGPMVSTQRGQSQTGDCVLCLMPTWEDLFCSVCDLTSQVEQFDISSKMLPDPLAWPGVDPHTGVASLVEVGRTVSPTTPNGKFFVCTTAGQVGGSEPSWATSTVTDNTVTWQELSAVASSVIGNPISNCGYVGDLNAVGLASFDWMTKEYTEGDIFSEKLLDSLQIAMQSSMPQVLNVEFQEGMGSVLESNSISETKQGAALPFTLGTQLVSEVASYRAIKAADGSRINNNSMRYRGYPSTGFVVNTDNQKVTFSNGLFALVATGNYATIDTFMQACATAFQAAWRAFGGGALGAGTVSYTVGAAGFPVFSRMQPARFGWSGFNAASLVFGIVAPGCLAYAGFEEGPRCGVFMDNGTLYAHTLVPPVNPTVWKFIAAKVNGRIWRRQSISKSG